MRNKPEVRFMLAHKGTNEKIRDFYHEPRELSNLTVVRSRWVREMLKGLPEGVVVTGKKVEGVEHLADQDWRIRLRFSDGEEKIVDAVIGCDGINSCIRSAVLSAQHPDVVSAQ